MKLLLALTLCLAFAAAAPKTEVKDIFSIKEISHPVSEHERSLMVDLLVRQLIAFLRRIINNGSPLFGIPPLDPLEIDHYHLYVPAGLINLDLDLKNIKAEGLGSFVVHTSRLRFPDLTFDLDISVPELVIVAEQYDLIGNLFTAIPLYGKGKAIFEIKDFRFGGKLYLKQSDDGKSVLIDRIEDPFFEIPYMKPKLTGAIGGGEIDEIVNSVIEEVVMGYINRFRGALSMLGSAAIITFGNPILNELDTWRYISIFM